MISLKVHRTTKIYHLGDTSQGVLLQNHHVDVIHQNPRQSLSLQRLIDTLRME